MPAGRLAAAAAVAGPPDPVCGCGRFACRFPGPVGLAAGFDGALGTRGLADLGLGCGSRHGHRAGSAGNPRPRFRLTADRALVDRMDQQRGSPGGGGPAAAVARATGTAAR